MDRDVGKVNLAVKTKFETKTDENDEEITLDILSQLELIKQ